MVSLESVLVSVFKYQTHRVLSLENLHFHDRLADRPIDPWTNQIIEAQLTKII